MKAPSSIDSRFFGRLTSLSFRHIEKQSAAMAVTFDGIVIEVSSKQLLKARVRISVMEEGREMLFSLSISEKAQSPI